MLPKIAALSDSAGKIAHDFNNILAAISGSAALIEMGGGDTSRHIRNIYAATNRGAEMMRHLLALSPRMDGPLTPVEPEDLLAELKTGLGDEPVSTHPLSTFASPGLGPVSLDGPQVLNALRALIDNARDAMPAGGPILVTAQAIGADEIAFSIHDSGPGLAPELQAKMFEPFFTTKPKGKGTGLGLPLVLRIVHRHGGRLLVRSEPGQGTAVTCVFPRQPAPTG